MATNNSKSKGFILSSIDTVGHIARNKLEQFGGYIDQVDASKTKAENFKAVDLSNYKSDNIDNSFAKQTLQSSQQLLGPRVASYGKYAKKVVPDSVVNKAADSLFSQVAKLAETWSKVDLPSEHRFDGIEGLDDQQRNALAQDIANQNRALAVMGGVTGLAGLPGLLADSLWLLLVSLRTVYQLATVYNTPLKGKQGIKLAYAVLSNADLSKTQEKQAFLAGLSVLNGLIDKAGLQGFEKELKNMGVDSENMKYYAEKVSELAEQFDISLDASKFSWLIKFLPITSVAVGTYYNNQLIAQVIGTAKATFAPEPKIAQQALSHDSQNLDNDDESDENDLSDDSSHDQSNDVESIDKPSSSAASNENSDITSENS